MIRLKGEEEMKYIYAANKSSEPTTRPSHLSCPGLCQTDQQLIVDSALVIVPHQGHHEATRLLQSPACLMTLLQAEARGCKQSKAQSHDSPINSQFASSEDPGRGASSNLKKGLISHCTSCTQSEKEIWVRADRMVHASIWPMTSTDLEKDDHQKEAMRR